MATKTYRNATHTDIRFITDARVRVRITPGDNCAFDENESWVKQLVNKGHLVEIQNEATEEAEMATDVPSTVEETAATFEPLPPVEENASEEKVSKPARKTARKAKSKPSKK